MDPHVATAAIEATHNLLKHAARHGRYLVPTLQMFARTVTEDPAYLDPIDASLRAFVASGGRVLFGTDVGYMTDYDTRGELTALERCGFTSADILRSMTTEPADAFGSQHLGRVEPGMRADLVLLDTTTHQPEPTAFAHVSATIKSGRIIYSSHTDSSQRDRTRKKQR